jgi:hypothetical protein
MTPVGIPVRKGSKYGSFCLEENITLLSGRKYNTSV